MYGILLKSKEMLEGPGGQDSIMIWRITKIKAKSEITGSGVYNY